MVRNPRRSREGRDLRRCLGTLVIDDLADDPRVGTTRQAPGDSSRGGEGKREPPATAARTPDPQRADHEDGGRRAR
jgi:hypothetical protein